MDVFAAGYCTVFIFVWHVMVGLTDSCPALQTCWGRGSCSWLLQIHPWRCGHRRRCQSSWRRTGNQNKVKRKLLLSVLSSSSKIVKLRKTFFFRKMHWLRLESKSVSLPWYTVNRNWFFLFHPCFSSSSNFGLWLFYSFIIGLRK